MKLKVAPKLLEMRPTGDADHKLLAAIAYVLIHGGDITCNPSSGEPLTARFTEPATDLSTLSVQEWLVK